MIYLQVGQHSCAHSKISDGYSSRFDQRLEVGMNNFYAICRDECLALTLTFVNKL